MWRCGTLNLNFLSFSCWNSFLQFYFLDIFCRNGSDDPPCLAPESRIQGAVTCVSIKLVTNIKTFFASDCRKKRKKRVQFLNRCQSQFEEEKRHQKENKQSIRPFYKSCLTFSLLCILRQARLQACGFPPPIKCLRSEAGKLLNKNSFKNSPKLKVCVLFWIGCIRCRT